MSTETKTVDKLREHLVEKATADEAFRARLLSDPKGAIEEELGVAVPASLSIEVHEESAATTHLILPPHSKLSESDLQAVAGGGQSRLFGQNVDTAISDW